MPRRSICGPRSKGSCGSPPAGRTSRCGREIPAATGRSWDSDVVTVDPQHLRSLAPDLCRGLALHEASHAAVTVLHRILPETLLVRLLPLLNAIEEFRIVPRGIKNINTRENMEKYFR